MDRWTGVVPLAVCFGVFNYILWPMEQGLLLDWHCHILAYNNVILPLQEFSELCCGDKDQFVLLLERINSPFVRANTSVLQGLMRLIPFLAFGEEHKMEVLVNSFKPYLDFTKYVYVKFDLTCIFSYLAEAVWFSLCTFFIHHFETDWLII